MLLTAVSITLMSITIIITAASSQLCYHNQQGIHLLISLGYDGFHSYRSTAGWGCTTVTYCVTCLIQPVVYRKSSALVSLFLLSVSGRCWPIFCCTPQPPDTFYVRLAFNLSFYQYLSDLPLFVWPSTYPSTKIYLAFLCMFGLPPILLLLISPSVLCLFCQT